LGDGDGGDAMVKVWALLILARKLCFDFALGLLVAPSLPACADPDRDRQAGSLLVASSLFLSCASPSPSQALAFLRFCVFLRVPLLLGPRQLFR